MRIKVISDSTCDLSPELIEKYDISLTCLIVTKQDEEFQDGLTITPAEIFAHVAAGGDLCTTASLSMGVYSEVFSRYAQQYDGIIHISLGSGFSSSYQNACLAAKKFPNVRVVDSNNLSSGQGLVVLKACELAQSCTSLDDLKQQLIDFSTKVEACFLIDKLDYLVKGGRCSTATALGANLLNLKPCIEVSDGSMHVGKKYRGSFPKCLGNYVKDRLENRTDLDNGILIVTKADVSEECYQTVMDAVYTYGSFETIYDAKAGCTVSCHCGPGTMGIFFVRK